MRIKWDELLFVSWHGRDRMFQRIRKEDVMATDVGRRFLFTAGWMRRLGVTKDCLLRHMRAMEAARELPETADDVDMTHAIKIGGAILTENTNARCEADKAGADWQAFFEAILALLIQLMPYILKDRARQVPVPA